MGYFDDEGCLYIVDRRNDLMRYRGCNVSNIEKDLQCMIAKLLNQMDFPFIDNIIQSRAFN